MDLLNALRLHQPGQNNVELMNYLKNISLNPVKFHTDLQALLDLQKREVEKVIALEFQKKRNELMNSTTIDDSSNKRGEVSYAVATLVYLMSDKVCPAIRNVDIINKFSEEL